MQGDQAKALKIVSRRKGWDPDKIYDPKTNSYGESIENFNKPTKIFENQAGTGELPEGIHDSYPQSKAPEMKERISFNTPDVSRENANRRTSNANPNPGKPGALPPEKSDHDVLKFDAEPGWNYPGKGRK